MSKYLPYTQRCLAAVNIFPSALLTACSPQFGEQYTRASGFSFCMHSSIFKKINVLQEPDLWEGWDQNLLPVPERSGVTEATAVLVREQTRANPDLGIEKRTRLGCVLLNKDGFNDFQMKPAEWWKVNRGTAGRLYLNCTVISEIQLKTSVWRLQLEVINIAKFSSEKKPLKFF